MIPLRRGTQPRDARRRTRGLRLLDNILFQAGYRGQHFVLFFRRDVEFVERRDQILDADIPVLLGNAQACMRVFMSRPMYTQGPPVAAQSSSTTFCLRRFIESVLWPAKNRANCGFAASRARKSTLTAAIAS